MERLIVEKEVEKKEVVTEQKQEQPKVSIKLKLKEEPKNITPSTEYLNSLDNSMTIGDLKRQEEKKKEEQFKIDKEVLIQQQFQQSKQEQPKEEKTQQVSQKVIEKPNYDLIEENKKIVKLKKDLEKFFDYPLKELSMGMSQDYKEAVKYGATMLRIGRKLFIK